MGYNNMDSASKINLDTDYGDGDKLYVSSSYESLFSILIILLLPLTTYYLELEQSYHACEMYLWQRESSNSPIEHTVDRFF